MMARIVYGVSGEGNGHAMRSIAVIDRLDPSHELLIICGGKAYEILSKRYPNVMSCEYFHMIYESNSVSGRKTLWTNLLNVGKHIRSIRKVFSAIDRFKPDVIISDFEYMTNYYALIKGIPNIMIDNQSIITCASISFEKRYIIDYIKSWTTVNLLAPHASYRFISSFFIPRLKRKDTEYCPLLVADDVITISDEKNKTSIDTNNTSEPHDKSEESKNLINPNNQQAKNHILVYQTSESNPLLLEILKKSHRRFIVYGFNRDEKIDNITLKRFGRQSFISDLTSCDGVIMNGGLTLISEALILKKPILSIPVKKQFEQILNAIYLSKLGLGKASYATTDKSISKFIDSIPDIKARSASYHQDSISEFIERLEIKIEELILDRIV